MKYILPLLLLSALFTFNSCKDDGPDERDPFIGIYEVDEYCNSDSAFYTIEIIKSGSQNKVEIIGDGLYEADFIIEALVSGKKLTIPIQRRDLSTSPAIFMEFSGTGSLRENYLRIDYQVLTVQDEVIIGEDSCTAYCYK